MPCFCTTPEEDLEEYQADIKKLMREIVHKVKLVSTRGYSPEIILKDTHELMDHMFHGKCDANWYSIIDGE